MNDPYFFGYGSLVNTATHTFHNIHTARARGWRRAWRHTALRSVSFLTVVPDALTAIDGVIASVPGADWAALDLREGAYDRVPASDQIDHDLPGTHDIAIYAIPPDRHGPPTEAHPILMSYLECVLQGYHLRYGPAGVAQFIATTDGWTAPILDDRDAPQYPRHQPITPEDRTLFNDHITDAGGRILMSLA
ncbi:MULTISPECIES: gamma-glutamylcyclotransferase [unclassified Marinovum]